MGVSSMTGFARVEGEAAGISWAWELKSVNGRALDLRLRLPPGYDGLEAALRAALGSRLKRGSISANLTINRTTPPTIRINREMLERVIALIGLPTRASSPARRELIDEPANGFGIFIDRSEVPTPGERGAVVEQALGQGQITAQRFEHELPRARGLGVPEPNRFARRKHQRLRPRYAADRTGTDSVR